ncbi:MAG: DivIVA domain-containing protein, partial [Clostridia bacterium]|nr:DivIVA domain-containing protein [Clostridia bacterium]
MPVDFKKKLFQKALWGYAPAEVDEYIAYVTREYTKLERRLAAVRRESSGMSRGEEKTASAAQQKTAQNAGQSAGQAKEKSVPPDGEREALLRERAALQEERGDLERERTALAEERMSFGKEKEALAEERLALEAEKVRLAEEASSLEILKASLGEARSSFVSDGEEAEELLGRAAREAREQALLRSGLEKTARGFRRDVRAFAASMESLVRSLGDLSRAQSGAVERFSDDADRFLAALGSSLPEEEEDGGEGEDFALGSLLEGLKGWEAVPEMTIPGEALPEDEDRDAAPDGELPEEDAAEEGVPARPVEVISAADEAECGADGAEAAEGTAPGRPDAALEEAMIARLLEEESDSLRELLNAVEHEQDAPDAPEELKEPDDPEEPDVPEVPAEPEESEIPIEPEDPEET